MLPDKSQEEHPHHYRHVPSRRLVHDQVENVPLTGELLYSGLVLRMAGRRADRCRDGLDERPSRGVRHRLEPESHRRHVQEYP